MFLMYDLCTIARFDKLINLIGLGKWPWLVHSFKVF